MMTHVKKNAQNLRGYTKPSYIECAVQFRNQSPFQTQSLDCRSSNENSSYYRRANKQTIELNEYFKEMERKIDILSRMAVF